MRYVKAEVADRQRSCATAEVMAKEKVELSHGLLASAQQKAWTPAVTSRPYSHYHNRTNNYVTSIV
eukprot:3973439-Amphidinium_carterae.1